VSGAVAILGAGAWGTALAITAQSAGHDVRLWARDASLVADIEARGENAPYLPGVRIDPAIRATADAAEALAGTDLALAVVPAQSLRTALTALKSDIPAGTTLVLCAKGIERETGLLLSAVAHEILPRHAVAALSGPSFAADVGRGLPTAVVLASEDGERAAELAARLSTPAFRCYSSDDLTGVEIGGALKNVLAIAAGAVAGAGLGASAQAAMVTRGFVELRRLGAAFGAKPETLMGLSGLGDLVLTCASGQSRNYAYGVAIGRGEKREGRPLAEGVATAAIAARIARERGIEAPIVEVVDAIIAGTLTVQEAVGVLMTRPLKAEAE
jgi:glycerol-3-phosphate dehydrogenase (NAD(P)+)